MGSRLFTYRFSQSRESKLNQYGSLIELFSKEGLLLKLELSIGTKVNNSDWIDLCFSYYDTLCSPFCGLF